VLLFNVQKFVYNILLFYIFEMKINYIDKSVGSNVIICYQNISTVLINIRIIDVKQYLTMLIHTSVPQKNNCIFGHLIGLVSLLHPTLSSKKYSEYLVI